MLNSQLHVPSMSFCPVIIALIEDQIKRSREGKVKLTFLNAKRKSYSSDLELDASDPNFTLSKDAKYEMIFTHPEAFVSCKDGMELFQSQPYQCAVKSSNCR